MNQSFIYQSSPEHANKTLEKESRNIFGHTKNFFSLLSKSKVIRVKVINRFGFFFSLSKRQKTINVNEQVNFSTVERTSKETALMFLGDMKMGAEERKKSVFIIFVTYGSKTKPSFPRGKRGIAHESRLFFL